jgi:hypothetical protein
VRSFCKWRSFLGDEGKVRSFFVGMRLEEAITIPVSRDFQAIAFGEDEIVGGDRLTPYQTSPNAQKTSPCHFMIIELY